MATRGRKGNGTVQVHSQEANFSHDNSTDAALLTAYTLRPKSVRDGDVIHIKAHGAISTVGAAPGTMTIAVLVGGVTIVSYLSATLTTGLAAEGFFIDAMITVRSVGATGTAVAGISVQSGDATVDGAANQSTAQTVNFDTASAVTLSFDWSVANAANILDVEGFSVQV
jgi:hypothetical protein